ncbi:hypothetical protein C1H46_013919 [Malus baccata]|uniref:Protein kinase domain-containing protein n=1 Tax=Malus baccata TaxID=106549 RepID=A0A540MQI8_MALBA|nr:hypothetical protein C1H46_013919 [Malus baccata]
MILEEALRDLIKKKNKKKNVVLVGIPIDSQSTELLGWALVKVAQPGDCVIAAHVCRSSDYVSKAKTMLDGYVEAYEGLCDMKKVELISQVLTGRSVRKALVREAKKHSTVAIVVGISNPNTLGSWDSTAKFCGKKLRPTTDVVGIHNGKIVFRRCTSNQLPGLTEDPRPSLCFESLTPKGYSSEFGDFEEDTETPKSSDMAESSLDGWKHSSEDTMYEQKRVPWRSTSLGAAEHVVKNLGWPLLRKASSANPQFPATRDMSVVQWVMSLPDRSPQQSPQCTTIKENPFERSIGDIVDESMKDGFSAFDEIPERLKHLLQTKSSGCRWFSHELLKASTSQFSSENLIGKGGCNLVYKGTLSDGKPVAVKIMKSSKEAWKDFTDEVDIMSSLKHKNILPLLGFCIKDNVLISVYDFLPKGSLEANLHGKNNYKSVLSWEVRFNVAVGIAKALSYLNNECPQPVIHRDVKSSNILLTKDFEPQAKPKIEKGDVKEILDPNLDGKFDEVQVLRMVHAAKLCITRSARLRPKMTEILKLLKGDSDVENQPNSQSFDIEESENWDDNDDEVYPNSSAELHLGLALLDVDDDTTTTSSSSVERSNSLSWEEYLKGRWSRSSSFD